MRSGRMISWGSVVVVVVVVGMDHGTVRGRCILA